MHMRDNDDFCERTILKESLGMHIMGFVDGLDMDIDGFIKDDSGL